MGKPIRVQRKRTKGWKMPDNTVYVGRGSLYGSPYKISASISREESIELYRKLLKTSTYIIDAIREDLKGKNLACWCSLDKPCHADILLELANIKDNLNEDQE